MKDKKPQNHFDLKFYQAEDYFGDILGYQLESFDRRKMTARTSMKVHRSLISAAGRIHGGAMMAFADFSCGAAVFVSMKKDDKTATVELKSHFFKQVFEGQTLIAEARLHFRGNRLAVAECEIFDKKSGEKVAMAVGTYNIMSAEKPKPRASASRLKKPDRRSE